LKHIDTDSLALFGLNCYHLVKAGKGKMEDGTERNFFHLCIDAATDKVALAMAVSMLALSLVAV